MLVLMAVGRIGLFAQTIPQNTDFSGTYFIASNLSYDAANPAVNFYLCPAEVFYDGTGYETSGEMPYITTFKTNQDEDSRWEIRFAETENDIDYYYILHIGGDNKKYLTHNITKTDTDNRLRLHLQSSLDGDNSLFYFSTNTNIFAIQNIMPKEGGGESLNPPGGNVDSKVGGDKSAKIGNTTIKIGGLIGLYTAGDNGSKWRLEDIIPRPTIQYVGDAIEITYAEPATFYYTTDGTLPTTSSTKYTAPFAPDDAVTTIRAIAVRESDGEVSNASIYQVLMPIGTSHPYLIQSKESEYHYMIPSAVVSDNTTVNTLNVPCKTMVWYVEGAGVSSDVQYYYIKNVNGSYLFNEGTAIYMKSEKADADGYKFSIGGSATDGFYLMPKGKISPVNKDGGNVAGNAHNPIKLAGKTTDALSLWYFKPFTGSVPQTLSFNVSTDDDTYYYTIQSKANNYYLLPTAAPISIAASLPADKRESVWVIKEAGKDQDQLLTYYTIRNAYTGEYFYYLTEDTSAREVAQAFRMEPAPAGGVLTDRFQFAIVQTRNGYNIIPKVAVDNTRDTNGSGHTKASYNCLNRTGNKDVLGTYMDTDDNSHWYFTEVTDVPCLDPVVVSDADGNITLTTSTNASEIRYTTDGSTPTVSSTLYNNESWPASERVLVRAIAKLKSYTSESSTPEGSSSSEVTLLNNPQITLAQDTYAYNGTAREPAVSTVSIAGMEASATQYTVTYSDNIHAGTASVALDDVEGDNVLVWNAATTFTIAPAALTISAEAQNKTYGADDPILTYTYAGLATIDDIADVVTGDLTRSEGEDVGTYPISQGTLAVVADNNDYTMSFTGNTLTIVSKTLGDATSVAEGISVGVDDEGNIEVKDGERTLTKDTDYTESEPDANGVVTVTGKGNYGGFVHAVRKNFDAVANDDYADYVAAFVSPQDWATPTGMTAYIVKGINVSNGTVLLEAVGYLPQNVPVLLLTTEEYSGFPVLPKSEETTAITTEQKTANLLKVADTATEKAAATIYLYYRGEFVLNIAGTLPKDKVYMDVPGGSLLSPAPRLLISRNSTTGIADVPTDMPSADDAPVYDLSGRLVTHGRPANSQLPKGLYIRNGRKVVAK